MYEAETQELILARMLARVSSKYDKREGSIIYDATAPASVEFQNFFIELDTVLSEVFADTASREYLIKRCAERGITPKPASYAVVKASFAPVTLEIPLGTRFSHEDYNYIVVKKIEDGIYGKSITDPCLGWEKTEKLIRDIADLRRNEKNIQ